MVGILPKQHIQDLIKAGAVSAKKRIGSTQIQPASLDLRLGTTAYRIRASFLPGTGRRVSDCLTDALVMHKVDLSEGAVLETGCVYLVPLMEGLELPAGISAAANPKSSTGRLDVFTRVICDGADAFEAIGAGYKGPLYVEIAPRTFSVLAHAGEKLVQLRFRRGTAKIHNTLTVSIDLSGTGTIGYLSLIHI